jgi:hypothetical protein
LHFFKDFLGFSTQHGSGFIGESWDMNVIFMQGNELQWIFNSDCYSLVFTEKSLQNYFLCAYHLCREGLTNSSAKRRNYRKAKRVAWFEEKILDMHMAPNSLQVYESYGLILLFMIVVFDEVNDFVAASEHSIINGLNGISTGL